MITLYGFGPFYELADPSPFCLKVHAYLTATKLEFKTEVGTQHLRRAPKGKLPYIDDDGTIVCDSSDIIEYLESKLSQPLDSDLNAEQKAISRAYCKMMDENLYWCMVYSRWISEQGWPTIKQQFFGSMPFPLKLFVPGMLRKGVRKALHMQGLGRHSEKEILQIARKDLIALSDFLGTKDYFLINKPTILDISAYAYLAELILPPLKCDLNDIASSFDNLVAFVKRMHKQLYG